MTFHHFDKFFFLSLFFFSFVREGGGGGPEAPLHLLINIYMVLYLAHVNNEPGLYTFSITGRYPFIFSFWGMPIEVHFTGLDIPYMLKYTERYPFIFSFLEDANWGAL